MEIMNLKDNIDNNISVYGDKLYLSNVYNFFGISYDDEYLVKDFIKFNNNINIYFDYFNISLDTLNKKIKDLNRFEFKFVLLFYSIYTSNYNIVLDYFDKGLSYKYKKLLINYFKIYVKKKYIVISNDIIFLYSMSDNFIIYGDNKLIYEGKFSCLFSNNNINFEMPDIIKFINIANNKGAKLSYTVDNKELLKDIYRSVK